MNITRGWKHKINIKQYLTEDDSNEAVVKAAQGVISELKKLPQSLQEKDESNLLFIIDEFETL